MSRHRNVRNLVAEEEYYDDYDDDYYDDYDDGYDDGYYSKPPLQKTPAKQPPKSQPQPQSSNNKSKKGGGTLSKQPQASGTKVATFPGLTAATTSPKPAAAPLKDAAGIQTPPPGFSVAPPPGWGTTTNSAKSTNNNKSPPRVKNPPLSPAQRGGVQAPPPGFSVAPPPGLTAAAASSPSRSPSKPVSTAPGSNGTAFKQTTTSSKNSYQAPPLPQSLLDQWQQTTSKKPTVTIVILGHVDAGKSTLTGHLLWEAAAASSSTKDSRPNNFAWLLDEDETERDHGITMDVATKTLEGRNCHWVIHDAPGHADYVPHMITGTALADVAVAVVDVTDSLTSTARQLQEHVVLAKGLGIGHVLVALNKLDMVDWKEEAYRAQVQSLSHFLFQTVGWAPSKVQFIPLSGLLGTNVYHPSTRNTSKEDATGAALLAQWYGKGPSLWQAMEQLNLFSQTTTANNNKKDTATPRVPRIKLVEKPLRLLVTDIFQETRGGGVAVRVKVVAGWFQPPTNNNTTPNTDTATTTTRLMVWPVGEAVRIVQCTPVQEQAVAAPRSSNNNNNKSGTAPANAAWYVVAGEWVDLILSGLDLAQWSVGHVLGRMADSSSLALSMAVREGGKGQTCVCRIYVLDTVTVPIIRGTVCLLHIHALTGVPCYISTLIRSTNTKTNGESNNNNNKNDTALFWKDRPRALTKQTQAVVELTIPKQPHAIVWEAFADCRALGRFVLRRNGESIAVGRIEQVLSSSIR